MSGIERVGVIGCGLMGAGIAEVCARAGMSVIVKEVDEKALNRGRERVSQSIERAVKAGKLSSDASMAALGRIEFVTDFEVFGDRQLIIEAVAEVEETKIEVYGALSSVMSDELILASNTSSLPIARLSRGMAHPERFIGIHFFNPVPVLPLVEIIPSLRTNDATCEAVEDFVSNVLGKTVIRAQDRGGFVVNAILVPFLLSAIRMVESGFADAKTVDTGMEAGCAHPMGPLRLSDYIGLDTVLFTAEALFQEYREAHFAPPPLLARMVEAGHLGRKSGRGFYQY